MSPPAPDTSQIMMEAFNAVQDPIFILNLDSVITHANQHARQVFGNNIIGMKCHELVHDTRQSPANCPLQHSLRTGKPEECEMRLDLPDPVWCKVSVFPIRNAEKKITGAVHIVRNVDEYKQIIHKLETAEKRYRALNQELEAIIDNIHGLVFYKDINNRLIRINRAFADAHGMSKDRIEGKSCFDLYPHQQAQAYWDDDKEVLACRTPKLNIEEPWQVGDEARWVLTSKVPRYDEDGNPIGVIGTAIDITERKKAEENLLALKEDLERSNRDLEQFAYVASHDLQEPVRVIRSYLDLIGNELTGKLKGDQLKWMQYIRDACERMQNLIQDLLAYSRIGRNTDIIEAVSADQALDNVLADLDLMIKRSNARISRTPLPTVLANPGQLERVFTNLIRNAIKYHSEDSPKIEITCEDQNGYHVFTVADNGIGIAMENHERIFEIFQRLHRREDYPGTGIGLAICKKIVESMGGSIWVESEAGKGSRFRFILKRGG